MNTSPTELLSEYLAIRERVGISDLSDDGKYLISGEDRTTFLQNLISNDIHLANGNKGIYSTLLTGKGKIIADFYLYPLAEAYLLAVELGLAEKTFEHLMRVRLRSKIKIAAPPWGKILVSGPYAKTLVDKLFKDALPEMEETSIFSQEADALFCVRQPQTGEETYHLYYRQETHEEIWTALLSHGASLGVMQVGKATLALLQMEAGMPQYGVDLTEEIIPIEAGLEDRAISYTKGCYPGQEVVARIRTYGHVNKHRMGLLLDGNEIPSTGKKIFSGAVEVGWVTLGVFSPFLNRGIATAYLRTSAAVVGTELQVEGENGPILAIVTDLPFYHQAK